MSDILSNAGRYNPSNTFRSDGAGNNRGNQRSADGGKIGFDCSGFTYHVLRESGYNVPYAPTSAVFDSAGNLKADWATQLKPATQAIPPGTLVYFQGHVGIVQSFDPATGQGTFVSMTGSDNSGKLKTDSFAISKDVGDGKFWGGTTPSGSKEFLGFAAVKPDRYDRDLDQHVNDLNANKPVFNIPEATNAGFVTLPNNGGFVVNNRAVDLSQNANIIAGNNGVQPPPPIDAPNPNTPFAQALASLESSGQPNNGYGAWRNDGIKIGAVGRYGFRHSSLEAIGWRGEDGNWTDEAKANGVSSTEEFRNSPAAQEAARLEYMAQLKVELKANGMWAMIGDTIAGVPITEEGLLAAAWNQGARAVYRYFSGDSVKADADADIISRLDKFKDVALTSADPSAPSGVQPRSADPATRPAPLPRADGSVTYDGPARSDAADGSFNKGDILSFTYDKDGRPINQVIWHKTTDGSYEITSFDHAANTETHTILESDGKPRSSSTWNRDTEEAQFTRQVNGETILTRVDRDGQIIDTRNLTQEDLQREIAERQTLETTLANLFPDVAQSAEDAADPNLLDRLIERAIQDSATPSSGKDATPTPSLPALDENNQPLPEIGKVTGLTDDQWNALVAQLGTGGAPSAIDWSKGNQYASNDHADTVIDVGVNTGDDSPATSTPPATSTSPAGTPWDVDLGTDSDSQAPAPVETATPRPVGIDPGTAAVNSMANLILAIQNGNDLSAVLAGMSLVNNLDRVLDGAGNVIPTELSDTLGVVAGGLNLVNALENGDAGGILVSGIGLINTLGNDAATKFISGTLGNFAGEMVPYLGVINSLAHDDPIGAVAGYLMTNPATFVFGAIIAVFGGMFADEPDIPVAVGNAAAHWDEAGGVAIDTTYDEAGGGRTANAWLNNLVRGLQDELATRTDDSGRPLYGLDPTRLPGIGYAFDADTGDGYLRLSWTDADGTPQWRQYEPSGMRNDGQGVAGVNDLARDFFLHASDAILPAWEADTRFQQGGDATAPAALFTGEVSADGASIARTVLTLGAGATATTLLDLDGDGYLESTQWTASPILAIDLNGDGLVSAFELVDGRAGGDARNSLARLDANGDGRLDAGDPAFAALRLWADANGDGVADDGESRSLAEAGIASLGYAGETVTVGRADGASAALNRATLTSDTRGVARWLNEDGLYEAVEDGDTTLFAVNQNSFDGDPDHVHGGEANPDARPASPPTPPRTSIPIAPFAFVPAAAATPARAVREVTREMIASADGGLFGAGHRGSATLGGPEVSRFQ